MPSRRIGRRLNHHHEPGTVVYYWLFLGFSRDRVCVLALEQRKPFVTFDELKIRFPRASKSFLRLNTAMPSVTLNCQQCGKPFTSWQSSQRKYCSPRCAYDSEQRVANRHRKERGSATCKGCGTVFVLTRNSGKGLYCSQRCAAKTIGPLHIKDAQRRRSVPDPDKQITFNCKTCGAPTTRYKQLNRKYCSSVCSANDPEMQTRRIAAINAKPRQNTYSRAGRGWVAIGGKRHFFRSSWEANYARYLEFLTNNELISAWEYEPMTFWFHKIKRGVRSFLPDFRVTTKTSDIEFHEVKGWMDAKSKTKIKRMAKYYPSTKLVVIDTVRYREIAKTARGLVPGWTHSRNSR